PIAPRISVAIVRDWSTVDPSKSASQKPAKVANVAIEPVGTAKRSTLLTKPGRVLRREGARARKNAGIPIVRLPTRVKCRGRNGNGNDEITMATERPSA